MEKEYPPEPNIYDDEAQRVYVTGQEKYLYGKPVKPAEVVRVTHIAGAFVNCATTEYIVIGYHNGAKFIELYKAKPAVTSDWVHWNGNLWLREGQRVAVYCADVANGELMKLKAHGKFV